MVYRWRRGGEEMNSNILMHLNGFMYSVQQQYDLNNSKLLVTDWIFSEKFSVSEYMTLLEINGTV